MNPLIDPSDYDRYDQALSAHLNGELASPDQAHAFVAERLLLGVYAQRQDELCMVRSKLPGGRLQREQLLGYAEALERYSESSTLHLSTRQNIQFHDVPMAHTGALQRLLGSYAIATREAGGNTVRNITACPLAGDCPHSRTDIQQHIEQAAGHFVRSPQTQSLPRKFKMAFSACAADCAMGRFQDLGVIASERDGQPGFRLWVGGGLGSKPREGQLLAEFVPEDELLPAIEAIVAVHDRHSDRKRKMRSRTKFLVERFGIEGLREEFQQAFKRTLAAFVDAPKSKSDWRQVEDGPDLYADHALRAPMAQQQPGLWTLPVSVPAGQLNALQLRRLYSVLAEYGLEELRISQRQNLLIPGVREADLEDVQRQLSVIKLGVPQRGDDVVACPGTRSCQLGVTASHHIAPLLSGGESDLRIRVNGCQNGCAAAELADIGLIGKGRRHFDRLVPSYALRLGGRDRQLAISGPEVPAARAAQAVIRIEHTFRDEAPGSDFSAWVRSKEAGYFDELLSDLVKVNRLDLPALLRDHGDTEVFSVQSVGVGECAGAQLAAPVKLLLDAAYENKLRDAFFAKGKHEEAAEALGNALRLNAQALYHTLGRDESADAGEGLLQRLPHYTLGADQSLAHALRQLDEELQAWRQNSDELAFASLHQYAARLLERSRGRILERHEMLQEYRKKSLNKQQAG